MALDRVGARDAAQLAHARGGGDAAARDVADDEAQPPAREGEGVEPVAADRGALAAGREVRGQRDAGRIGEPAGEEVALQRGGDRALALVGGLRPGAPRALLGQALARGLGAPALAQVVDLDEDREDLAVVLAHAPGEDRDREVLVAGKLELRGRGHRGAGERGREQRVERQAIVLLDQRADGHAVDRTTLGELLQHGVGAQQAPVAVDERCAGRQRAPRQQEHLVGARAGAALALEVAEDADLRAQHVRLEGLEHVVDGARLVAAGDLGDVGAHRGQEDDRRGAAALAPADELRGLEAVHARHLHVEQDDGEVLLQQRLERLLARPGRAQAHLQRLEHRREREQVLRPVVDEQDARRVVYRCSHTRMRESSWSTSTGLVM